MDLKTISSKIIKEDQLERDLVEKFNMKPDAARKYISTLDFSTYLAVKEALAKDEAHRSLFEFAEQVKPKTDNAFSAKANSDTVANAIVTPSEPAVPNSAQDKPDLSKIGVGLSKSAPNSAIVKPGTDIKTGLGDSKVKSVTTTPYGKRIDTGRGVMDVYDPKEFKNMPKPITKDSSKEEIQAEMERLQKLAGITPAPLSEDDISEEARLTPWHHSPMNSAAMAHVSMSTKQIEKMHKKPEKPGPKPGSKRGKKKRPL